jgi:hypothetical protein
MNISQRSPYNFIDSIHLDQSISKKMNLKGKKIFEMLVEVSMDLWGNNY